MSLKGYGSTHCHQFFICAKPRLMVQCPGSLCFDLLASSYHWPHAYKFSSVLDHSMTVMPCHLKDY